MREVVASVELTRGIGCCFLKLGRLRVRALPKPAGRDCLVPFSLAIETSLKHLSNKSIAGGSQLIEVRRRVCWWIKYSDVRRTSSYVKSEGTSRVLLMRLLLRPTLIHRHLVSYLGAILISSLLRLRHDDRSCVVLLVTHALVIGTVFHSSQCCSTITRRQSVYMYWASKPTVSLYQPEYT